METLEQRIARLHQELAEIEAKETMTPEDIEQRQKLTYDLAAAEIELEQQKEKEAREQKKESIIGEYNDTLDIIFTALFPEDTFKQLLGINEYEQLRQDYKRAHNAYHSEQIDRINAEHAAEIEHWREKFRKLTEQAMETENQLAEAKRLNESQHSEIETLTNELSDAHTEISTLKRELEYVSEDAFKKGQALHQANERIAELEAKLEQAQKAKEPIPAGESVNKVLEDIKLRSRREMSADELLRRFEERQKNGSKVMVIDHGASKKEGAIFPPPVAQVNPFRPEVDSKPVEQSTAVEPEVRFQENQPGGVSVSADKSSTSVADANDLAARIEALEKRVDRLERHANIPAGLAS